MTGEGKRRGGGRPGQRGEHFSRSRPAERVKRAGRARSVAFEVMRAVDEDDAYANLVLPALIRRARLDSRDAGLATELTYGALRGQGFYDAVIARVAGRPLDRIDPPVLDVLRLGAHQLLATRIPGHAAVSETVGLARERIGSGPGGFVNAVLRRVGERPRDEWLTELRSGDTVADLAVEHSHPEWIVRALRESLAMAGRPVDELPELLAADNAPPRVTLAVRPGLADPAELLAAAPDATAGPWSPYAVTLAGGDPAELPAVRQNRARVQDAGSQVVAAALAAATPADPALTGLDPDRSAPAPARSDAAVAGPASPVSAPADPCVPEPNTTAGPVPDEAATLGERWLDLCAGPGGKTALLSGLAADRGATLVAVEPARHRADLVRRAVTPPAGSPVEVRTADGRDLGTAEPGRYDRVLVDAPCTGLGALRRRPEARWRRTLDDLSALAPLQRALLRSALAATRPGGVVAYVTCSPHPAETTLVVADVLKDGTAEQLDARPAVLAVAPDIPQLGDGPAVQLWPHVHGTDAMFLALLRRR